jgi:hypothetical protein
MAITQPLKANAQASGLLLSRTARPSNMRLSCAIALCCLLPGHALAQTQFSAYVQAAATLSDADANWLQGGTGALGSGDGVALEGRFGLTTQHGLWRARLSALARSERSGSGGRRGGLLEALLDYGALDSEGYRWRAGFGFAGTSRENVEEFWQTPYTLSLSALNSWIGEEFRPIGVDYTRRQVFESGSALDISAGVFIGNDTGPAVLSWRGYALHNRLSVYGESLPLPRLNSLRRSDQFGAQRSAGSQPFGPDLDGRPGYSVRMRYAVPEGVVLSAFFADNRGDRDLHDGDEYAWDSQFLILGVDLPIGLDWKLLAESQHGSTQMGFAPGANVAADFHAHYVLLSYSSGAWQYSTRLERFGVREVDFSAAENNQQKGEAATAAILYRHDDWLLGLEVQHAKIRRPGNRTDLQPGFATDPQQGGTLFNVVARRYF